MKVTITRTAQADLLDIGTWVARDNPAAANRLVSALFAACETLSSHPKRYPAITAHNLRKRPHGEYVIFYRVTDRIDIMRILHSARDWATVLEDLN